MNDKRAPTERDWLAELALKVARRLADPTTALASISVLPSPEPYPWIEVGLNGWGVDVAALSTPKVTFSLWVDSYLHSEDKFSFGCWAYTTSLRVAQAAVKRAEATGWGPIVNLTGRHRDPRTHRAPQAQKSRLRAAPETPVFDRWAGEQWLGHYLHNVLRSPTDNVVGRVLSVIGELASFYAPLTLPQSASLTDLTHQEEELRERRIQLYRRLERPAQAAFRAKLRFHFGSRCVVTGCAVPEALEAAHIVAVADGGDDHLDNGLLLRADLHLLFDTHQLWFEVDQEEVFVRFSRQAREGGYSEWDCRRITAFTQRQREALRARTTSARR